MGKHKDLSGEKFGKWIPMSEQYKNKQSNARTLPAPYTEG